MNRPLLILDLEGVLVERACRRRAASVAAGLYLEEVCCILDGARLIDDELADVLAEEGGFESPESLCAGLVLYFLSALSPPLRPPPARARCAEDVRRAFREKGLRYGELMARKEIDPRPMLENGLARGGSFAGMLASLQHDTIEGYILRKGRLDDPEAGNLIGRTFLEVYLGPDLFETVVGAMPSPGRGAGLIHEEANVVSLEFLRDLSEKASLSLAAPRRLAELHAQLDRLGLREIIPAIVSLEDIEAGGGAMRPDPWALKEAHRISDENLGVSTPSEEVYVLSEDPTQLRGAVVAGYKPVGFTQRREVRKKLLEAGALAVIRRLPTLQRVFEKAASR